MRNKINFLLVSTIRGITFNPYKREGLKLEFQDGPIESIRIYIEGTEEGDVESWAWRPLVCKVVATRDVRPDDLDFADSLIAGRYKRVEPLQPEAPIFGSSKQAITDNEGLILSGKRVPFRYYPSGIRQHCESAYSTMSNFQRRFLALLSWHQDLKMPVDAIQWPEILYWNTSGKDFHAVDFGERSQSRRGMGDIVWTESNEFEMLGALRTESETEPLAQELMREAFQICESSPRSALLVCATALEIATKQFISRRLPTAEWLMTNLQSPPIHKILRNYLPLLFADLPAVSAKWSNLKPYFSLIDSIFEARNNVAHRGDTERLSHLPDDYLDQANSFLYLLDVIDGHTWALRHLLKETLDRLDWKFSRIPKRDGGSVSAKVVVLD